jgi:L-2-hydroxyglutarate oxidase LhgO
MSLALALFARNWSEPGKSAMDKVDCVIAGAGVVGLAIGRALALAGREVLVLESADAIGTGSSSRNSEVIHAGIYYPTGSLKAKLCVAGKQMLYAYCNERSIAAPRVGKLIVATAPDQLATLEKLAATAAANGIPDMVMLSVGEAHMLEPNISCIAALHSPSTGIIDSHALMLSLQGDIENSGGMVVCNSPVLSVDITPQGFVLQIGGEAPLTLLARSFINSAGHFAPALASATRGLAAQHIPQAFLAKGHYFSLSGVKSPFKRLIYPVPDYSGNSKAMAGLGIHATVDLGGQVRFGPDVTWVDTLDYAPDPARADAFYAAIRSYWPALPDGALMASYTGIRPKIVGPGAPAADFRIDGPQAHGIPDMVNLFGIESPGLTSSLAIAEHVAALLR